MTSRRDLIRPHAQWYRLFDVVKYAGVVSNFALETCSRFLGLLLNTAPAGGEESKGFHGSMATVGVDNIAPKLVYCIAKLW